MLTPDPAYPPDTATPRLLFTASGLEYRYPDGTQALTDIHLDIRPGERIALVGPNGSGKTTLIKQLCGLLSPTAGQVRFKGHPLAGEHLERSRLSMGLLFQDPDDQLFGQTLLDDVCFGLRQKGFSQPVAELAALRALQRVGLAEMAYKTPHNLSVGQKKRAALAGLLAIEPEVLLLDEPTANLDPLQEELMLDLLARFSGTLICVSHDLIFLYETCQRAVVMDKGRIRHDQSMRALVSHRHSLREHGLDFSFRLTITPPEPAPSAATVDDPERPIAQTPDRSKGSPALIELRDFHFAYPDGTQALRGIDLTLQQGERVALVGENGAGKTTLLACLLGLHQGQGIYRFDGEAVTRKTRGRLWRDIQMVFQDCADRLFCPTVREEITFGPRQLGLSRAEIDHRLKRALAQVHLEGFAERVPLHLSGGERKRLALACVLAMNPTLIILDEPTAGLDPRGEELLLAILRSLPCGLLMVSHDIYFVQELTRRALVLHQGNLLEDLSIEKFLEDRRFGRLNGLSCSYRRRAGDAIRQLQHAHEHTHMHDHLHRHPHKHGEQKHDHLHHHAHQHPHLFFHTHPDAEKTHDHAPRRYHDHDHPDHDENTDDHH